MPITKGSGHLTEIERAGFGGYRYHCSCGWDSYVFYQMPLAAMSDPRESAARIAAREHEKEYAK